MTARGRRKPGGQEQGTVLLKNADSILPLGSQAKSIAVIGADGGTDAYSTGGGSSQVRAPYVVTPYDGIKNRAGAATTVTYTQGSAPNGALPVVPSSVLTPPSGTGNGLLGQYYNNQTWSGNPALVRTDPNVDFTWGAQNAVSPGPGVNSTNWSARWTGTLTAPATGTYTFSLTSDDGSILTINGTKVVDDSDDHGPQTHTGSIALTQGNKYQLDIDYNQATGGDQVHLGWQVPGADPYSATEQAAKNANVAVVFANDVESEGTDRPNLSLPFDQDNLISAVANANPNTIVVLNTGSAVTMPWLDKVKGVVEAWYPGQEDGNAIAAVLFGDVDPSGKLPLTFPKERSGHPRAHAPAAQAAQGLRQGRPSARPVTAGRIPPDPAGSGLLGQWLTGLGHGARVILDHGRNIVPGHYGQRHHHRPRQDRAPGNVV